MRFQSLRSTELEERDVRCPRLLHVIPISHDACRSVPHVECSMLHLLSRPWVSKASMSRTGCSRAQPRASLTTKSVAHIRLHVISQRHRACRGTRSQHKRICTHIEGTFNLTDMFCAPARCGETERHTNSRCPTASSHLRLVWHVLCGTRREKCNASRSASQND